MNYLTIFASAEAAEATHESSDLFSSIGINWTGLILQIIAFLALLWLLKKFVYPPLVAMLDKRDRQIEESTKAAVEAEKNAAAAEEKTAKLIKQARKDADELLSSAKAEATALVDTAEKKSRERAEQIAAAAEDEIAKSIVTARKALRQETMSLVAEATEKVVGKTVSKDVDKKVVAEAVSEAEK